MFFFFENLCHCPWEKLHYCLGIHPSENSRFPKSFIDSVIPEPRLILEDFNDDDDDLRELYDDNRSSVIYDLCDNFNVTIINTGEIIIVGLLVEGNPGPLR